MEPLPFTTQEGPRLDSRFPPVQRQGRPWWLPAYLGHHLLMWCTFLLFWFFFLLLSQPLEDTILLF